MPQSPDIRSRPALAAGFLASSRPIQTFLNLHVQGPQATNCLLNWPQPPANRPSPTPKLRRPLPPPPTPPALHASICFETSTLLCQPGCTGGRALARAIIHWLLAFAAPKLGCRLNCLGNADDVEPSGHYRANWPYQDCRKNCATRRSKKMLAAGALILVVVLHPESQLALGRNGHAEMNALSLMHSLRPSEIQLSISET